MTIPTGTITFLFTDIEGSTQLWEKFPDQMKTALARHDGLLRKAIEDRGGYVFKTVGDAFCAAFAEPTDALEATLDAQRALQSEKWPAEIGAIKARAALHTGEAEVRDGDYFGPPVNRVARLMSAGHGGQTLISFATQELLRDRLPADIQLQDMGQRRLKDLVQPERIYQVNASGLPTEFAPLKTLDAFRQNLPVQLTSFVGRESELGVVKEALASNHLVTLIGPGGTGKTRLSLQAAADMLDHFSDGLWFVELAPVTDPEMTPQTTLTALGLRDDPARSPIATMIDFLQPKKALIVLDNCEHLVEAGAQLAAALLRDCPKLTILASSREALGVAGERVIRVPSLKAPDPHQSQPLDEIAACDAVRLFVDRASAAQSSFALTENNAAFIAKICQRLDGIPLALELAAARVASLPVEQIAARLDDSFRLLTGGSRTALPRQQTLRALIDWSYNLLNEQEQLLLRRLAVFQGGFTLEAAENVCADKSLDVLDVLDLLAHLVGKSLASMEQAETGRTRYRLLETIRQYARDRLLESGEIEQIRDCHLTYFVDFAERAFAKLCGSDLEDWPDRLTAELDNAKLAVEWAFEKDPRVALQLVGALVHLWEYYSHYTEGVAWTNRVLELAEGFKGETEEESRQIARHRSRVYMSRCAIDIAMGHYQKATQDAQASVAAARESGNEPSLAQALGWLLFMDMMSLVLTEEVLLSDDLVEEGMALARRAEPTLATMRAYSVYVSRPMYSGDFVLARQRIDEMKKVLVASGIALNPYMVATTHQSEARLAYGMGDTAQEIESYRLASEAYRSGGFNHLANVCLSDMGHAARRVGMLNKAVETYHQTLAYWADFGNLGAIAHQAESFGLIAIEQGQDERAARLLGAAETLRAAANSPMTPHEQAEYDAAVKELRDRLDSAALDALWAEGNAMNKEQAVQLALTP